MDVLKFDLTKHGGKFKLLNATNGGPICKRHATDQARSNFDDYKAARIPYTRNHDSAVNNCYGGPYSHDISCIFPNFYADPTDPASYDFACTDEEILKGLAAGTKTFFRLGQTIEHQIVKHNTLPPKDFQKWAVICEHIIRHYTEGWADGFYHDMPYWEIWNEPDLDGDDSPNKRTWGGTKAQFFDFYEIAAKHLKSCFPHLKIGGPAIAGNTEWAEDFLCEMQKRKVPLDFFSWHIYAVTPERVELRANKVRELLDKYGYGDAESILNEWNYIKGWGIDEQGVNRYIYSLEVMRGIKGASFVASVICKAQASSIDMLMYYDTRPSGFNGAFDFYTLKTLKGYYPLYWYGMFYDMKWEIPCDSLPENIYALCGVDENGKTLTMLTYYTDDDNAESKDIKLEFGKTGQYEVCLVDETHDGELVKTTDDLNFTLSPWTMLLIREI
ncbi:MAG: hypothetical protein IJF58_05810 [Clostridia bacterium]|nr:hypothetical protein [Clostridia bacterium]